MGKFVTAQKKELIMKFETFDLERIQSLYENTVAYNLTESGIHPLTLRELLSAEEIDKLLDLRLGYGQTNGAIKLREAVSRHYTGADLDNVLVTNGSAESNFTFAWSNIKPGDEVIVMLPNYMQIWGIARYLGADVKPFYLCEEQNWAPDLEQLKKLASSKTKMICLCNPNNPTGAVLSSEEMQEIVKIAGEADALLHVDEIYRGAELKGDETPSFYGLYDNVVVTMSLSKSYSLPGLRMGWLVGPKTLMEKGWAYHDYTSISTSLVSQYVAELAMQPERRMKLLTRGRTMLRDNLAGFQNWIDSHADLFHFIPPKAGGIAFMRYNMDINSTELSNKLRLEKNVFIIPGDCFGMDQYLRMGIGGEKDHLLAGLDLIDETLNEIR
jgi:aspartate/methionine/tyrosine aminotransferase